MEMTATEIVPVLYYIAYVALEVLTSWTQWKVDDIRWMGTFNLQDRSWSTLTSIK
jgi:hypothetical protein